jgi:hypothetical protein
MPNHVTHRVIVTSPNAADIDAFVARFVITQEEEDFMGNKTGATFESFDFNTVVPMPDSIRNSESSSAVSDGLAILGRSDIPGGFGRTVTLEQMLDYPWVKVAGITDVEALKAALLQRCPNAVEAAEKAIKCYEETGHTSWYSWSIENWGTKWNAYSFDMTRVGPTHLEMKFDTAWSTPDPIFEKLAELLPIDTVVTYAAIDEGGGFVVTGTIVGKTHKQVEVEQTDDLYEFLYGERPEVYEEDVEEDETAAAAE